MTDPEIKICGVSTSKALDAAIAARAHHVGFVFFAPSPRNVDLEQAAGLKQRASGKIRTVGLFVDADDALLGKAVAACEPDAIQLHGAETPERVALIRARFGRPVWKALAVRSAADVARATHYAGAADRVLFDAKTPDSAALPGGMGLSFDWSLVAGWSGPLAWGLAGGLTPANVADALRQTGAPLVDTSSGVETGPGVKDVDKIAAFCKAARQA